MAFFLWTRARSARATSTGTDAPGGYGGLAERGRSASVLWTTLFKHERHGQSSVSAGRVSPPHSPDASVPVLVALTLMNARVCSISLDVPYSVNTCRGRVCRKVFRYQRCALPGNCCSLEPSRVRKKSFAVAEGEWEFRRRRLRGFFFARRFRREIARKFSTTKLIP